MRTIISNDAPLTPAEIRAWLTNLAPNDYMRVQVLKDLIRNRVEDRMSDADYAICTTQLAMVIERIKQAKDYQRKHVTPTGQHTHGTASTSTRSAR